MEKIYVVLCRQRGKWNECPSPLLPLRHSVYLYGCMVNICFIHGYYLLDMIFCGESHYRVSLLISLLSSRLKWGQNNYQTVDLYHEIHLALISLVSHVVKQFHKSYTACFDKVTGATLPIATIASSCGYWCNLKHEYW